MYNMKKVTEDWESKYSVICSCKPKYYRTLFLLLVTCNYKILKGHSPWHVAFAFRKKNPQHSHPCTSVTTPIPMEVHSTKLHQLCNNPYQMCSVENFLMIALFHPMCWTLLLLQNWRGTTQFVSTIRNTERKGYLSFPFLFVWVSLLLFASESLVSVTFSFFSPAAPLLPVPSVFQMLQASLKSLVIFSAFLKSSSPVVISAVIF